VFFHLLHLQRKLVTKHLETSNQKPNFLICRQRDLVSEHSAVGLHFEMLFPDLGLALRDVGQERGLLDQGFRGSSPELHQ